jgi:hypothetical protein
VSPQKATQQEKRDQPPRGAGALTRFAEQMKAKQPQPPLLLAEDGEPLEVVETGDLPEQYDPHRRAGEDDDPA